MDRPLLEDIRDRLDEFTATEKKAAHALLANYPMEGLGTVASFAKAAGVSSPTILRFVARLGFPGFAEFQKKLRSELESQLNSPLARSAKLADNPVGDPHVDQLLENVRETFAHMPKGELAGLVQLLSDERKTIHVIGGRFTDGLARYMAAHLRIVRPNVMHVAGQQGNWLDQLIGIGPRDVILVFDIRRYQTEIIQFAEAAAKQGATVALVTDSWMSPVGRIASHVLPARVAVPSPWDSSLALMAIAEVLIAGVTRENQERAQERMRALEALRNEVDPSTEGRSTGPDI
ncbi:MAG: MurR/RpiR family transcriptional regulator [Roseibium sp.]|uniref:MurR/RpiR family transcriptional regulator n=1 Tax=Roseibium sp. TaxID=1936156 RepID=UPI001AFD9CE2|nr:MurR/RpiR family transcriptional regulator [Roseibium sp.]MBO6508803.1 MurR/RpiR family transcriptional regulator [Roseibium sp.]MBO6894598.1 MurR/RpiR family transcriptional regulator [Roseibium sp.]MBO6928823.1 MurR/RpiR family transcriptional regulator [Roseibium sp.]